MNEKALFAERLRNAMTRAGYEARPAMLEREFNTRYWGKAITLQAVRAWLRGDAIPSQEKLQVLAEWLKIEPQVLRYGEEVTRAVRARRKSWEEGIGYQEREVFEAFLGLPAAQRKIVREVIMVFARAFSADAVTEKTKPRKNAKVRS